MLCTTVSCEVNGKVPMPFDSFQDLERHLAQLFQAEQYQDALETVRREGPRFPGERPWVDYWQMCAAARLKNYALVYQIAKNNLSEGLWYGDVIWRNTPSFEGLQGDPHFERIITASKAVQEQEDPSDEPVIQVQLPDNHTNTSPLLVALHGNGTTAHATLPFWQPSISEGWVLALPQSDQAMYKGAYVWNDLETAYANVQVHFAEIQNRAAYDPNRVVLGGHSLGSLIAIQISLQGILDVCGFIAIGPVVPVFDDPAELASLLNQARARSLRGYLIVGEDEEDFYIDGSQDFHAKLDSAGIVCKLEFVPGADHDYSSKYDPALLRALRFVGG